MGSRGKRGSITVFLALLLTLLVGLVLAGIQSVRMAAARTQILCGVDLGLYSLFAQYDRELFDRYDLLALGGSGGAPDLASMYRSFESYLEPVLQQGSLSLKLQQGGLTGYRLLCDENGEVLYRQASKAERLAARDIGAPSVGAEQRSLFLQRRERGRQWESALSRWPEWESYANKPLCEQMGLRLPEASGELIGELFSRRAHQQGLMILGLPGSAEGDLQSFRGYLRRHLDSYRSPGSGRLSLGLEYLAFGYPSDQENLEAMLRELLHMEEGRDLPAAEETSWEQSLLRYERCLKAVRELLQGNGAEGVDYVDYLEIFLQDCGKEELLTRGMDLMEQDLRASGRPDFCLDACVTDAEVLVQVQALGQRSFHAVRHYGYD